jgi:hypothetical protein
MEIPELIFEEEILNQLIFAILKSSGIGRRVIS